MKVITDDDDGLTLPVGADGIDEALLGLPVPVSPVGANRRPIFPRFRNQRRPVDFFGLMLSRLNTASMALISLDEAAFLVRLETGCL